MRVLKNKKGGTVILITIMMVILFPVIMSAVIDISNIYQISKRLKVSLNAAADSASSRVDWNLVPQGKFFIQIEDTSPGYVTLDNMPDAFTSVFDANFIGRGNTSTKVDNYYQFVSENGNVVKYYFTARNIERTPPTVEVFPDASAVPDAITDKLIQVDIDRPTVFGVATVEYKMMPVFGERVVHITKFATAQLNVLPRERQSSATYGR